MDKINLYPLPGVPQKALTLLLVVLLCEGYEVHRAHASAVRLQSRIHYLEGQIRLRDDTAVDLQWSALQCHQVYR